MRGLGLLWLFVRLGLQHELAYRANLVAQALSSAAGLATALAFLAVLRGHVGALAGWRPTELLALWGVFFVLTGLFGAVVQPGLRRLVDDVRAGTLDLVLTRPLDAQLHVSVRQVEVWKLVDVAVGLGLLGWALLELDRRPGLIEAGAFALALGAGGAIVYGCCLMLAALAFWLTRVEDVLILFLSLWETGRWPIGIYPPWLRGALTFLLPVGLATTVPAEALIGRATPAALVGAVAVAALLLGASRWVWLRGLRRYTGAS